VIANYGAHEAWRGTRVLVTGAGGFIGSHAVEALVRSGARIRALLRYNSSGDRGALRWSRPGLLREVEFVEGDLRDPESVAGAVAQCQVVLHFGAQVSVPYSYINVRDFFETNTMGTLNLALAACRQDVQRLVLVSSSEVYGSAQFIPMSEKHPLQAQSPYAASKIGAEQLVLSLTRSFGLSATIVRPFNTYGPRQTARAIIPAILSQAVRRSRVHLGSLWPRRDLTFVDDTVAGVLALARASESKGEIVNIGTGHDVSVGDLIAMVEVIVGHELDVQVDDRRVRPAASEVSRLQCDPSKAASLVGWAPTVTLEEGLRRTADWICANAEQFDLGRRLI